MIGLLLSLVLASGTLADRPMCALRAEGWMCAGFCYLPGNKDGGHCREAVATYGHKSENDAVADLRRQCAKVKPPPGGCSWEKDRPRK